MAAPSPPTRLIQRQAGVFAPALVQKIDVAVRQDAPDEAGDGVAHQPEIVLAALYRLLGPRPFINLNLECLIGARQVSGAFGDALLKLRLELSR